MKRFTSIALLSFFALSSAFTFTPVNGEEYLEHTASQGSSFCMDEDGDVTNDAIAKSSKKHRGRQHHHKLFYQLGTAFFNTTNPSDWFSIDTLSFPTTTTLSLNRNGGSTQGHVALNPTGLTLNKPGNYSVSFSAVLQNLQESPALITVYVALNGVFDPTAFTIGNVVTLETGVISAVQATGILQNVTPGTQLSLVATNGGGGTQPIQVAGWNINAFRIVADNDFIPQHHRSSSSD